MNDLGKIRQLLNFEPDCKISSLKKDPESIKYDGCSFEIDGVKIIFRSAKTTVKKVGLFVTLWVRSKSGVIRPFDISDDFDFAVIRCRKINKFGFFVFPKSVFLEKGIVTGSGKKGKLGFRVYPPWETQLNSQAQKTQDWQKIYFSRS